MVVNTLLVFLYKSVLSLVHFYLSSQSLLSAPVSCWPHLGEVVGNNNAASVLWQTMQNATRRKRMWGGGEWLMPLPCWDWGERWNKEIRMRWERKVAADLSLIWRHLWAYTAAAQKPGNNWAAAPLAADQMEILSRMWWKQDQFINKEDRRSERANFSLWLSSTKKKKKKKINKDRKARRKSL